MVISSVTGRGEGHDRRPNRFAERDADPIAFLEAVRREVTGHFDVVTTAGLECGGRFMAVAMSKVEYAIAHGPRFAFRSHLVDADHELGDRLIR